MQAAQPSPPYLMPSLRVAACGPERFGEYNVLGLARMAHAWQDTLQPKVPRSRSTSHSVYSVCIDGRKILRAPWCHHAGSRSPLDAIMARWQCYVWWNGSAWWNCKVSPCWSGRWNQQSNEALLAFHPCAKSVAYQPCRAQGVLAGPAQDPRA